jgi:hypothetical protein
LIFSLLNSRKAVLPNSTGTRYQVPGTGGVFYENSFKNLPTIAIMPLRKPTIN